MKITEESIRSACNLLADTLIAKNKDYGNSVEEQFQEYGITSLNIRLDDKRRRMKQLSSHTANVKTESMAETILDEAGYAILGYILLSSNEEKQIIIEESTEDYLRNKEYLSQL